MNPEQPPTPPSDLPPQPPPIEVHAEPVRPDERGRVFDAPPPPPPSSPPPPREPSGGATSEAPPGGATPPPPRPEASSPAPRATGWAVACHLLALIDFGVSVVLLGLIATLVVWLIKKDDDPEVDFHGKESLNFQFNLLFWWLAAVPLTLCCGLGALMMAVLPFLKLGFMLFAGIKAANGERWRYPYVYRVLQ